VISFTLCDVELIDVSVCFVEVTLLIRAGWVAVLKVVKLGAQTATPFSITYALTA
jgi:hypothetical protein